jgi:hypothetical protein
MPSTSILMKEGKCVLAQQYLALHEDAMVSAGMDVEVEEFQILVDALVKVETIVEEYPPAVPGRISGAEELRHADVVNKMVLGGHFADVKRYVVSHDDVLSAEYVKMVLASMVAMEGI